MENIKEIGLEEEVQILYDILNVLPLSKKTYLGSGSSRIVFSYGKDKVVKIAIDEEGYTQNRNEIQFYQDFHNSGLLAKIYGFSKRMIVMEKVDIPYESYEIGGIVDSYYYSNHNEFTEEIDEEVAEEIATTYSELNELLGYTEDNLQIGFRENGEAVCYDYGYDIKLCFEQQVSYSLYKEVAGNGVEQIIASTIDSLLINSNSEIEVDI